MKKWTLELIYKVAKEMYEHGTFYSERYSATEWKKHKWPEVDSDLIYAMLDCQIKSYRLMDGYNGIDATTDTRRVSKTPYGRSTSNE